MVGCGVIGPTHADAIAGVEGARLVAVADEVPGRAQSMAERYNVRAYTDLDEMLEREDLDVVSVCTPSGMHGNHACRVMRTGRHVVVEKPMEISLEAIDQMLRVQGEMKVKMAVISQHRCDPASRRVRALIGEGAFGRLTLGTAQIAWWRSQEYYDSGAWRGTRAMDGGGVLMNQSIHSIDLLQWLMGRVHRLRAYSDTLAHRMETEDTAVAVLGFVNGALGTISATTAAYPGVTTRVEVCGDRGSAVIERDRLAYLHLAQNDEQEVGPYGLDEIQPPAEPPPAAFGTSHALQIEDMVRAIREDGTPMVDGQGGRHPVEIILGIYRSAQSGEEVTL